MSKGQYDAVVIGSGPNGLAAAITLAQTGRSVLVIEAAPTIGGGMRTSDLTRPGYLHDHCSAVHPLAVATRFIRSLPLAQHGLEWIHPKIPLAHPLDDGSAAVLRRAISGTGLMRRDGRFTPDEGSYQLLMAPLVEIWDSIESVALGPLRARIPKDPLPLARFGWKAIQPASHLAMRFKSDATKALFAGLAAHSMMPLSARATSAVGLVLALAGHVAGWPIPRGGSQRIACAMASYFQSLGGEIETNWRVTTLDELPEAKLILCDVGPHALADIAGERLPGSFARELRKFRYGAAAFKADWSLAGPIPWTNPACREAGTVHVGGSLPEIVASEAAPARGEISARPFVLVAQQSLFDATRSPDGRQTGWAYCHVPHGAHFDEKGIAAMTAAIEIQIERFAPGFRERILERAVRTPANLEAENPNMVGGDIAGGSTDLRQLFFRPTRQQYRTPVKGLYLCSASTPPGAGVHGLCGYYAASAAIEDDERELSRKVREASAISR
jgi:phytoene dehydrogenase-like protein